MFILVVQAVPEQGEDIFYDAVTDINGKENRIFLEKIFLYPVKSCRGIEVSRLDCTIFMLEHYYISKAA